jgi:hypothetical protein
MVSPEPAQAITMLAPRAPDVDDFRARLRLHKANELYRRGPKKGK